MAAVMMPRGALKVDHLRSSGDDRGGNGRYGGTCLGTAQGTRHVWTGGITRGQAHTSSRSRLLIDDHCLVRLRPIVYTTRKLVER